MDIKLSYAKNPKWYDIEHSSIEIIAKFEHLDNEISFYAHPDHIDSYSRDIFTRAIAGEFGEITEYIPPPLATEEQMADKIRNERNQLLEITDWTQTVDIEQTVKDKWAPWRQAMRDIPQQEGFPFNVIWPEKPDK